MKKTNKTAYLVFILAGIVGACRLLNAICWQAAPYDTYQRGHPLVPVSATRDTYHVAPTRTPGELRMLASIADLPIRQACRRLVSA